MGSSVGARVRKSRAYVQVLMQRQEAWSLSGAIERLMNDDGWKLCVRRIVGQPAVDHPITFD